jgi:SagB-type dehydrogenase family enzyme
LFITWFYPAISLFFMHSYTIESGRAFLKDTIRQSVDFLATDQSRGVPPPPVEKPFAPGVKRIDLPDCTKNGIFPHADLAAVIGARESCRSYSNSPLSPEELSFLLWATQGVRLRPDAAHALRTVPSAGCRHALETYLSVHRVCGLEKGIYRYLPLEHQLVFESSCEHLENKTARAALGQHFAGTSAVTFIWTAIPCRMEWRYGIAAHKVIALDAGHVCQNLYLACEAIGAGTCAIAAYDQEAMDTLLGVDGKEEFTIYIAPVGKKD